jgi:hypothetical protein
MRTLLVVSFAIAALLSTSPDKPLQQIATPGGSQFSLRSDRGQDFSLRLENYGAGEHMPRPSQFATVIRLNAEVTNA